MKAKNIYIKLPLDLRVLQPAIRHFQQIDSTNRFLLDAENIKNGQVVLADYQTAGRGRFNRIWQSPPEDALLFSILVNKFPHEKNPSVYTFLAAVSVYRALREMLPSSVHLSVKWPNDVLLNGKKVCGILVQGKISAGRYEKMVIGIGLNVNQPPQFFAEELRNATSLRNETGGKWDRIETLSRVLSVFDSLLIVLQESGEKPIIDMWENACDSMGHDIAIDDGKRVYRGIFEGLAENGALRLGMAGEIKTFYAGDVTVVKE